MSRALHFQRGVYTVPAKSTLTLNLNTNPNYFRIGNMGKTELYFAVDTYPTPSRYDLKISPAGSKMYADITGRSEVYVYNDGATACSFALLTFVADFDPIILAMVSDESLAEVIGGQKQYDGIIRGFNSALPSGNNTIGKVDLNTNTQLANILSKIPATFDGKLKGSIPAGSNKIGSVSLEQNEQLAAILEALTDGAVSGGGGYVEKLTRGFFNSGTATTSGVTVTAAADFKISCISMLSNDGGESLTVTVDGTSLELKSGEVLDSFAVYADSIKLTGNGVDYRLAYNERQV